MASAKVMGAGTLDDPIIDILITKDEDGKIHQIGGAGGGGGSGISESEFAVVSNREEADLSKRKIYFVVE